MSITYTAKVLEPEARVAATALDSALEDIGTAYAVFERDTGEWEVTVYPADEDAERVAAVLRDALPALTFEHAELPEENWVQRSLEGLRPVRAGRYLVHGSHDRDAVRAGDVSIEIDAGEAFGTGHHATTAGCLLAIERSFRTANPQQVLDLGTGSGVLAIAIAKHLKGTVLATDIDPVSVRTARTNAHVNGVSTHIQFAVAGGMDHPLIRGNVPYDLIVANILAEPLRNMALAITRAIAPSGTLILSGLLERQASSVLSAYRTHGLTPVRHDIRDGWATLTLRYPDRPLRRRRRRAAS